jgi:hypothetical protein
MEISSFLKQLFSLEHEKEIDRRFLRRWLIGRLAYRRGRACARQGTRLGPVHEEGQCRRARTWDQLPVCTGGDAGTTADTRSQTLKATK